MAFERFVLTRYNTKLTLFARRSLLHEIREGGPGASVDEDLREMGSIRRADETEDLQFHFDHVTALMRHK